MQEDGRRILLKYVREGGDLSRGESDSWPKGNSCLWKEKTPSLITKWETANKERLLHRIFKKRGNDNIWWGNQGQQLKEKTTVLAIDTNGGVSTSEKAVPAKTETLAREEKKRKRTVLVHVFQVRSCYVLKCVGKG